MKDRLKKLAIFGVAFALLSLWTVIVFSDVKGEHDVLLAQARPYEWIDQYRPLTNAERDILLGKVNPDELQDGDLLVMSYRGSILDRGAIIKDTDMYKIWKGKNCYELKELAMRHSLRVSDIVIGGKTAHIILDEGMVYAKGWDEIRSFAELGIIKKHCKDVLSVRRFSGAHASPAVY